MSAKRGRVATEEPKISASNSFNEDEVNALAAVLELIQRGGDASVIVQRKIFGRIRHKIRTMRETIDRKKAENLRNSTSNG